MDSFVVHVVLCALWVCVMFVTEGEGEREREREREREGDFTEK